MARIQSRDLEKQECYMGIFGLKKSGVSMPWTKEMVDEFVRCADDPIYFIKTYCRIVNLDQGEIPFKMWRYQEDMVATMATNRFSIIMLPRQMGKTQTTAGFLLHQAIFNKHNRIAILANKEDGAVEVLDRIQFMYSSLPSWLQPGVVTWNKGDIKFDNGSKIITAATSISAIRGQSIKLLYLDEFAHVDNDVDFWTSAYPTISSGKKTKVIITSTPRGMNLFYKLWSDSVNKTNPFVNVFFPWTANPTRDAKWEQEQRQILGPMKFRQEVSCLHGDTKLRVRKIGTFKDETLTFFELAKRLYQRELSDNLIIINQEYEIDTPKGFRNFAGLRVTKKKFISIKTEKNVIKATPDHKFIVRGREVLAKNLKIGKHIDPGVCVEDIWDDKETGFAFDPLNVDYGNIYLAGGVLNHNCEFLGSSGTLISGDKLQKLVAFDPQIVSENGEYLIYNPPKKDSRYIICVDSAEGVGSDYSAAIVFDVTQKPFTIAAIYKSNIVPPEVYSGILNILGKRFNNALLIVETNSVGYTVAKDLWFEYEYENMLRSADHGEGVLASFSGTSKVGVKTTKSTKRLGCSTLKSLIETDLMIINDLGIINELSTFVSKGTSWEAEKNKHDDLVMCLVIFAWFTQQTMFDEYVTSPINTLLRELRVNDSIGLPDMIITNGMEEDFYSDNGLDRSLSMDVVEREDIYERDNDERVKDEMPFF